MYPLRPFTRNEGLGCRLFRWMDDKRFQLSAFSMGKQGEKMTKVKVTVISKKRECAFKPIVGEQFICERKLPEILPSTFNALFSFH